MAGFHLRMGAQGKLPPKQLDSPPPPPPADANFEFYHIEASLTTESRSDQDIQNMSEYPPLYGAGCILFLWYSLFLFISRLSYKRLM
jgi:hypothetical protein